MAPTKANQQPQKASQDEDISASIEEQLSIPLKKKIKVEDLKSI